jgi:formate hydrogenlyase transcriptional activator
MSIRLQPKAVDAETSGDLERVSSQPPVGIGLNPIRTDRRLFPAGSICEMPERWRLAHADNAPHGERLDFEQLVGELSMRFIDLPPTDVDAAIEEAQRRIVEALDLDRTTLFQLSDDGDLLSTHSWWRPDVPALPAGMSAMESFPWMLEKLRAGQLVCLSNPDELPDGVDRASLLRFDMKSIVAVPLSVARRIVGVVIFAVTRGERRWPPETPQRVRLVASMFASVLARRHSDEALRWALAEVKRLSDQLLQAEDVYLRREVESTVGTSAVVGQSAAIRRVQEQVRQVAQTDATVLLLGETGSGKELFASQIHELSRRHGRAMVRVNCAAIPATLIESELFGREKGAYTGALSRQIGRFELADGSTIFLDEIGDLSSDVQIKLLRVLEERQIERLGSSRTTKVDTRIIAATHRDLEKRIEADTFREDLYYRLNVFPIRVPPLRERTEDIPMLVWRFVEDFSKTFGKQVESITKDNIATLQQYAWPGNVRELRNVVERALIVSNGSRLTIALPQGSAAAAARRSVRLADVEKEHIKGVLDSTAWRIRGAGGAAERLGLKATTLETRMAKLGLQRPPH